MLSLQFNDVREILCLGAHPDDIEIGCGGTILRLIEQYPNAKIRWIVFSGAGTQRESEARAAAESILADCSDFEIEVQGFTDSFFPAEYESMKRWFSQLKNRCAPDIVLTHRREDDHQDHRVLADLAWCTFRNHVIWEYEIPKYEGDLGKPNMYVPLDEQTLSRKLEVLLRAFPSQQEKQWFSRSTFEGLMRIRGLESGSPLGFAEGLYCRKLCI
ncbi:PIG-L deacetylase family protein [Stratiformator vulcanicus]|uniref:GlcNAc-PI de-N-acetylase n=1 Tax=Stratiformator vulcanicus TaxID=2527980 RepID=A0A517QW68_9PLAN|nr:PIG-L deacetylase family protein [Stratiformator vulcanicus]QDT35909.1 GlcNAc-PI de-N-acetylase [Stratiformator vulcanicus]